MINTEGKLINTEGQLINTLDFKKKVKQGKRKKESAPLYKKSNRTK